MIVKVFSTPACPYCFALKNYLKEHNIKFEDIDVSQDQTAQREMIEKSKQMGVPVLEVDGQIIVGFDQPKIRSLLKITD